MRALPGDLVRYVERAFSAADRDEALQLLGGAIIEDGTAAGPRLLRCAALSARGDLGRLREQVAHLRIDWRDIIVEGEYVVREGKLERVRDLNDPIGDSEP